MHMHEFGIPAPSSEAEITNELHAAGSESRALVFVQEQGKDAGHVFNARNVAGVVKFTDAANSNIDASSYFQGVSVWIYRTK
jgi:hypothetical protein